MNECAVVFIQYRIGNLELRDNRTNTSIEIIRWQDEMCWTIAHFVKDKSAGNYQVQFVGDRPLDEGVNWHHLRHLIKAGYDFFSINQEEDK